MDPRSPYLEALGERRSDLHPGLGEYFSAVPGGSVGIGEGVFERVGTPRRWLWPLYRMLQARAALIAGWEQDVPFTVHNRTLAGRAVGERTLQLHSGAWTMKDVVSPAPGGRVVDRIGEPSALSAVFDVRVDDGALALCSRAVGIRLGRLRARIPGVIAPVIRLRESHDESTGRQRVELTADLPVIGRVYEYRGTFTYRIEQEAS